MSAYESFLTQLPTNYNVEILTHKIILRIKYNDLQSIYNETDVGNIIGRKASKDIFLKNQSDKYHFIRKHQSNAI